MRVASWNINSVRSRVELLSTWLKRCEPDVVLLQETKCADEAFPTTVLDALGYETAHHGRSHYNGVAILSRIGLTEIECGFPGTQAPPFDEPRVISAVCQNIRFLSIYAPNGRQAGDEHWLFKIVWLERLRGHLRAENAALSACIVAGDFNVAPKDIDLYNPALWRNRNHATPQERAAMQAIIDLGFVDTVRVHRPQPGVFTWWNYQPQQLARNRGMRIDLVLVSESLAPRVRDAWIDVEVRRQRPTSDHAPVVVDFA